MVADKDCIFCKIVAGQIPSSKVYEDDRCFAFMDICPINKGHLLVIPKDHFENILQMSPELYAHVSGVLCRLAQAVERAVRPAGINVMQLNGKAANQVVPHVHFHLVPRWDDDGVKISAWDPIPGDMGEIAATAQSIRDNLST